MTNIIISIKFPMSLYIPDPAEYNDAQWEVAGVHMRQKANITSGEMEKIVDFLKTAN